MMTRWIATTGMSITDSSRCWRFGVPKLDSWLTKVDDRPSSDLVSDPRSWSNLRELQINRARLLKPAARDLIDLESWANTVVNRAFRQECWAVARRHALPAELATLLMLHSLRHLNAGDTILLLGGESNKHAVHLLCQALNKLLPKCNLCTETAFQLDPNANEVFNREMRALFSGHIEPAGRDARLVLTGGYKAVLMWITLRLSAGARPSIYYLAEDQRAGIIQIDTAEDGAPRTVCIEPGVG
jgi:hypothetical protein